MCARLRGLYNEAKNREEVFKSLDGHMQPKIIHKYGPTGQELNCTPFP